MNNSSLPIPAQTNDKGVTEFFDKYFFENRGFQRSAAISTGTILLQQAKLDDIKIFKLLDTLKGFDEVKLSAVVAEVLNYNRLNSSTLGFKTTATSNTLEKRNIAA